MKSSGTWPSQERTNPPSSEWVAATALVPATAGICFRLGFSAALFDSAIHDAQSLRNHSVGRRCSSAGAGPRLAAVIRTKMSYGPALAYSTRRIHRLRPAQKRHLCPVLGAHDKPKYGGNAQSDQKLPPRWASDIKLSSYGPIRIFQKHKFRVRSSSNSESSPEFAEQAGLIRFLPGNFHI